MEDLIKQYTEAVELNCRIFDELGDDINELIENYDMERADCKRRHNDIKNSSEIRLRKTGDYVFQDGLLLISEWDCLEYCFTMASNVLCIYNGYLIPAIQQKIGLWGFDIFMNPNIEEVKREVNEISYTSPLLTNIECFCVLNLLDDSAQRKIIPMGGKNGSRLYQCLKAGNQKEFINLLDDVDDTSLLRVYLATRISTLPSMQEYVSEYISEGLESGDDNVRCSVYSLGSNLSSLIDSAQAFLDSPSKEQFYEMLSSFKIGLRDAHGRILDTLNDASIHPLKLKEAKAVYERAKFIFGTDEPTQFDFKPFDLQIGTIVMSESGIYAIHRYLEDNPDEATDERKVDAAVPYLTNKTAEDEDYSCYFAPVAPPVNYSQMRKIAMLLAGKEIVGKSIIESQTRYIQPKDVTRFCYFFLHKCDSPDDLRKVDFSYPIQWLDGWESLKYLISRLYKNFGSLPSNLAENVVEAFRFKLQKSSSKLKKGQMSVKTFKHSKPIIKIISDEDELRIDEILKEVGM